MAKKILGIAPRFERATEFSRKWFNALIEEIKKYAEVDILIDEFAIRRHAEELLKSKNYDLVIFYDHGEEDKLIGSDENAVINEKNIELLNADLYTMACLAGKKLGVIHYKKNKKVFWGYDAEFVFTEEEENLFCRCANRGAIAIVVEEKSWIEAYKDAYEEYNKCIKEAKLLWSKIWLQHNRDHLVVYCEDSPPSEKKSIKERIICKLRLISKIFLNPLFAFSACYFVKSNATSFCRYYLHFFSFDFNLCMANWTYSFFHSSSPY